MAALRGALSGWLQLKLGEQLGGGGAERSEGLELCARWEASGAASGEALGAALEKAGSGGVATLCWRPPLHRPRPPCRGGTEGGGKGREGAVGKGGCVGVRRHRLGLQPGRTEKGTGRAE